MGFCRSFKGAVKETLLPELKKAVKEGGAQLAGKIIGSLKVAVSDGRLTKDEAEGVVKDVIQGVYGISRTAAAILVNATHEALNAGFTELDGSDADTEPLSLV